MPRSLSSLLAAASAGRRLSRSGSNVRQMRTSAVAFLAGTAEALQLSGGEAGEVVGQRRRDEPVDALRRRVQQAPLDRASLARRDQLADDRAQERMRDGRRADRAQAAEMADRAGEQLVVAEPFEKGAVIVVRAENEAQLVDAGFGLGVQDEGSVGELSRSGALAAGQEAGEDAVAEPPRGIRRAPAGQRERVGPAGPDRPLDGHASTLRSSTAGPAPADGRRAPS